MIAKQITTASMFVAACISLSTGLASADDDWDGYEIKLRNAKACIRRQARVYAAGTQEVELAARLAFHACEHLYRESSIFYAKAAGLSPSEAATVMPAVAGLATRELVEVISSIRQGRPVGRPLEAPAAK